MNLISNVIENEIKSLKNNKNLFIKTNLIDFLKNSALVKNRDARDCDRKLLTSFILDQFKNIFEINEIDSKTFWALFKKINQSVKIVDKGKTTKLLIEFFRFLYNKYKYDFFKDSNEISIFHLFDIRFKTFLINNYKFVKFNSLYNKTYSKKICIYIKGLNRHSTKYTEEEIISVNLTGLNNVYSDLLKEYIFTNVNNVLWNIETPLGYIKKELIKLQKIKSRKNYPNPDLLKFTCEEAILLKESIYSLNKIESTKNNHLGWIRRFFVWLHDADKAYFEKLFFVYVRGEDPPKTCSPKAVPVDHIKKINTLMLENNKKNLLNKMYYTIFHLLLQTQFRLNQLLHLKLDCLKQTLKPNDFVIIQNTKTTNGRTKEFVVSKQTCDMILEVARESQNLRSNVLIETYKNYIFLWKKSSSIGLIRSNMFIKYLKNICVQLKLPLYNALNLRYTHMTYSEIFTTNNKMSNLEKTVLTGHKNVNTTIEHYIDPMIEEMIESTLGFTLEENRINVSDKIIPCQEAKQFNNKEHTVENGCGICTQNSCTEQYPLSCYICKNFITTIEHEHFFEKQISILQEQKKEGMNRHDIESINIIISILAKYLIKIKSIKENNEQH